MLYIRRSLEGLYWDIHIILFRLSSSSTLHTRPTLEAEFSNSLYSGSKLSPVFILVCRRFPHSSISSKCQNKRLEWTHTWNVYTYIVWNLGLCNSISLGIWVSISLSCLSLCVYFVPTAITCINYNYSTPTPVLGTSAFFALSRWYVRGQNWRATAQNSQKQRNSEQHERNTAKNHAIRKEGETESQRQGRYTFL